MSAVIYSQVTSLINVFIYLPHILNVSYKLYLYDLKSFELFLKSGYLRDNSQSGYRFKLCDSTWSLGKNIKLSNGLFLDKNEFSLANVYFGAASTI